jgi:Fe-S-cluster-containing hydrogenase component 2
MKSQPTSVEGEAGEPARAATRLALSPARPFEEAPAALPARPAEAWAGCPLRALHEVLRRLGVAVVGGAGWAQPAAAGMGCGGLDGCVAAGADADGDAGSGSGPRSGVVLDAGSESGPRLGSDAGSDPRSAVGAGAGAGEPPCRAGARGHRVALLSADELAEGGATALAGAASAGADAIVVVEGACRLPASAVDPRALVQTLSVRWREIDVFDLAASAAAIAQEMRWPEPAVIVTRGRCPLREERSGPTYAVEARRCNRCGTCLRLGCPAISEGEEAMGIDPSSCAGCGLCRQVCRAGAIVEGQDDLVTRGAILPRTGLAEMKKLLTDGGETRPAAVTAQGDTKLGFVENSAVLQRPGVKLVEGEDILVRDVLFQDVEVRGQGAALSGFFQGRDRAGSRAAALAPAGTAPLPDPPPSGGREGGGAFDHGVERPGLARAALARAPGEPSTHVILAGVLGQPVLAAARLLARAARSAGLAARVSELPVPGSPGAVAARVSIGGVACREAVGRDGPEHGRAALRGGGLEGDAGQVVAGLVGKCSAGSGEVEAGSSRTDSQGEARPLGPGDDLCVTAPARGADLLLGFELLEALRAAPLLSPGAFVAVCDRLVPTFRMRARLEPRPDDLVERLSATTPRIAVVPASAVGLRGLDAAAVLLGVAAGLLPIPLADLEAVIAEAAREVGMSREAFARGQAMFERERQGDSLSPPAGRG